MKRSPLRRTAMRRKPSRSGHIPIEVRDEVRMRSGGLCEVAAEGCTRYASELHHRLRRSAGGGHTPDNLIHACHYCHHVVIHGHPALAYERGWLIRGGGVS